MKPYGAQYALSAAASVTAVASGLAAYAFAGIIAGKIFSGNDEILPLMTCAFLAAVCKMLNGVLVNVSTWISHHAAYHTLSDIRKTSCAAANLRPPFTVTRNINQQKKLRYIPRSEWR